MRGRKIHRLKPKKIKGRIQVLKAIPYEKNMVYIRRIDKDIFEYLLIFKNQLYSSYMVITPKKGHNNLTKDEISQCTELLWAGATATIDFLMGKKLEDERAGIVETFEKSRSVVNREIN
jgi:hypothetical protein